MSMYMVLIPLISLMQTYSASATVLSIIFFIVHHMRSSFLASIPECLCSQWSTAGAIINTRCRRRYWHATQDCVVPYVDHILHRPDLAISIASGSVRLWDLRFCCTMLSHVMRGCPRGILQSSGGSADRILLASDHTCNVPKKGTSDVIGLLQWV